MIARDQLVSAFAVWTAAGERPMADLRSGASASVNSDAVQRPEGFPLVPVNYR
jgi:hypothetical protein